MKFKFFLSILPHVLREKSNQIRNTRKLAQARAVAIGQMPVKRRWLLILFFFLFLSDLREPCEK